MCRRVHLVIRLAALLCVCVNFGGCSGGSNPNWSSTDQGQLILLLTEFDEAVKNLPAFQGLFSADAQPTDAVRLKFHKRSVTVAGPIQINGSTAIIPAKITDLEGKELGRAEWKAVKQDGAWRLAAAPLP